LTRKPPNSVVVDAPVSGGQAGAENGALTVMWSRDAYAGAEPVIAPMPGCNGSPAGFRQLTKMVNQIALPDWSKASRKAFICQKGRVDINAVIDNIQRRRAILAEGEPPKDWRTRHLISALRWNGCAGSVDLSCRSAAQRASLPVTALVDAFYPRSRRWAASVGTSACSPARTLTAGSAPNRLI
jgi:3-hydroxyisobutyrate dehydrogenase